MKARALAAAVTAAALCGPVLIAGTANAEQEACSAGLVALTFSDGPDPENTNTVLDILKEENVPATFFFIGHLVTYWPEIAARAEAEGHTVQNKTWSHPDLAQLSEEEVRSEFQQANRAIEQAGVTKPTMQRPPFGSTSPAIEAIGVEEGLTQVLWNVHVDEHGDDVTPEQIRSGIGAGVRNQTRAVVLLHDAWTKHTTAALPGIIDDLQADGYCFARLAPSSESLPGVGKVSLVKHEGAPPTTTTTTSTTTTTTTAPTTTTTAPTTTTSTTTTATTTTPAMPLPPAPETERTSPPAPPTTPPTTTPGTRTAQHSPPLGHPSPAGITSGPGGNGYLIAHADGKVTAIAPARHHGDLTGVRLNQPIIGIASTSTGAGYWLIGADGGVFSFGDATFHGSTGAMRLNAPVVALSATPTGQGYWMVAADGGIFSFGDARFYGSMGATRLNRPVNGMTPSPSGRGYRLVASDGGVFSFGDAPFYGSTGARPPERPVVAMAPSDGNTGYWLLLQDGRILPFGDARHLGESTGRLAVSIAAHPGAPGYRVLYADGSTSGYGTAP